MRCEVALVAFDGFDLEENVGILVHRVGGSDMVRGLYGMEPSLGGRGAGTARIIGVPGRGVASWSQHGTNQTFPPTRWEGHQTWMGG